MVKQTFLWLLLTLSIPLQGNNIFRPSGESATAEAHLNFMTRQRAEATKRAALWKVSALAVQVIASVQSGAGTQPGYNFGNVVANKNIVKFDKFSEAGTDGLLLCAKVSRGLEAITLGLAVLKHDLSTSQVGYKITLTTDEDYLQVVFGQGGDLHSMAAEAEKAYAAYKNTNISLTTNPTTILSSTPTPLPTPEKVVSAAVITTPALPEEVITITEVTQEVTFSEQVDKSINTADTTVAADNEIPKDILLFEEIEEMDEVEKTVVVTEPISAGEIKETVQTIEKTELVEKVETVTASESSGAVATEVEMAEVTASMETIVQTKIKMEVEPIENAAATPTNPAEEMVRTSVDVQQVVEEKISTAETTVTEMSPEEQEAAIQAAYLRASQEAEKELYRSQLAAAEKARAEEAARLKELEEIRPVKSPSRKIRLGVKAAVTANRIQVSNDQREVATSEQYQIGYSAGLTVGIPVANQLLFESGLLYAAKGSSRDFEHNNTTVSQQFNYIQLPLQLKHLAQNGKIHFFFQGGTYIAMALNGKRKITLRPEGAATESQSEDLNFGDADEDTYRLMDYGLTSGFGIQLRGLELGLSYDLGLANISNLRTNGLSVKNRGAGVFLGYGF